MADQRTLLLIADIAGYTRFMKMHDTSLVHAQQIIANLLEAVIDAAPPLKLAKLEGDAAFFYLPAPADAKAGEALIEARTAAIYRAFHASAADMKANTLCPCDGCQQVGNLKIKLVGHAGAGVAVQKVKRLTELAGVDVILVHRMLKNDVPVPEYLLVTKPVHAMLGDDLRGRASAFELALDDLGPTDAYYLDLADCIAPVPPARKRSALARFGGFLRFEMKNLPYTLRLRKACEGYRNVPDAH